MTIIPALPYTLTNGTVADANQVMADFNGIVNGTNSNGAHNGANSDITSLTGLTTPLTAAQGGTGIGSPGAAGNMMTSNGGGLWQSVAPGQGLQADPGGTGLVMVVAIPSPSGRLSLSSGVPVQTADVANSATIYYVPYMGNVYPWWDGTRWNTRALATQLTLNLDNNAAHTGYQAANSNFDLFLYNNGGTDVLVTGPAWASNTARSAALAYQNGVLVNAAVMAAKFDTSASTLSIGAGQATYVGTMRATANGQTSHVMNPAAASGGNAPTLGLWNYYNRISMTGTSLDNGAQYTYTSSTIRQARASSGNQANFVIGVAEDVVQGLAYCHMTLNAVATNISVFGLNLDSTTSDAVSYFAQNPSGSANLDAAPVLVSSFAPQLGYHYVSRNEHSDNVHANGFNASGATRPGVVAVTIRA